MRAPSVVVWRRLAACAVALTLHVGVSPGSRASDASGNPFEFLAPSIVVSGEDKAKLDQDQVLARTLPGQSAQLAVFVATRLNARPDALAAWTRAIAELKRSKYVLAVGRFSDPPQVSDLADLALDERDLDTIRRCRPGACGLKLSAAEIDRLTLAATRAGAAWRAVLQQEFRRVLVDRVLRYRAGGLTPSWMSSDPARSVSQRDAFTAILEGSPYLTHMPRLVEWLAHYPHRADAIESFFYWSKEHYGEGKPVVSITHVGIVHPDTDVRLPAVVVAGKQVYATHYVDGGLGLTMVVCDPATRSPYLVYVNRSQVDFLRGWFGGLVRGRLQKRLERDAPLIVRSLRERLESGLPLNDSSDARVSRLR